MPIPAEQNFDLAVSQAAKIRITMTPPQNVTGWNTRFRTRAMAGGAPIIDKATGSGVAIIDAPNGIFEVSLNASDLPSAGQFRYSFWRTDAGSENPIAVGVVDVKQTAQNG